MYNRFKELVENSKKIGIFMHISPDGDCIGSSLALFAFLRNMGKEAFCFSEEAEPVSNKLKFLPFSDVFNTSKPQKFDLAIAVDCGDAARIGNNAFKLFCKAEEHFVIDHHETGTPFVEDYILESHSASTTQIIYKLMKYIDVSLIDEQIATLIYCGLITDSGGFTFDSTTKETLQIAAELQDYNINAANLCTRLLKRVSRNVFDLTNRVLANAKFYFDNRVGIIVFGLSDLEATNTVSNNSEGIINSVLNIDGVELAISLAEVNPTTYKVGIRTGDLLDAGLCAKCFGGGGHRHASGCKIYGSKDEVVSKLLQMAKDMLND